MMDGIEPERLLTGGSYSTVATVNGSETVVDNKDDHLGVVVFASSARIGHSIIIHKFALISRIWFIDILSGEH